MHSPRRAPSLGALLTLRAPCVAQVTGEEAGMSAAEAVAAREAAEAAREEWMNVGELAL